MRFYVYPAANSADRRDVTQIEQEVFGCEKGIVLPELRVAGNQAMRQFIARRENGDPVGVLTAVETTGDDRTHRQYGIISQGPDRIARFTRLAVMREYRALGLPLRLILATHAYFVVPNRIRHTWLLFDAARASSSIISSVLGFAPGNRIVRSEYGLSRVLSRDEQSEAAAAGRRRGWAYVTAFEATAPHMGISEPGSIPLPDGLVPVEARQAA